MTEERILEIEKKITTDEDLFDDLMTPLDLMTELLAEVKRLHGME